MLTYSLYDFFLALASGAFGPVLHAIAAERNDADLVRFMSPDEIEQRCQVVRSAIAYQGGTVSLRAVCEWQKSVTGLFLDALRSTLRQSSSFSIRWDRNYNDLTAALMAEYEVSRSAVTIRRRSLGLLCDSEDAGKVKTGSTFSRFL
jgi:hypothetical protein